MYKIPKEKFEEMHPELREKYLLFEEKMNTAGIPYIVTSVARTIVQQMALFVQGRLSLIQVNIFRKIAGLYPLINDKENAVVTWTLNSAHVTNMFDKDLDNDYSRAFDLAIKKDKEVIWDIKVDINQSGIPDYDEAGTIGKEVGLIWGGDFPKPDRPHFEIDLKGK